MKDCLNKSDIFWGYLAKGCSICSGIITLPMVLRMLNENEIALNYILMSILTIVVLFDFSFSPQFSRNFAMVYGGSQEITREGVSLKNSDKVNFMLLYKLIQSAKLLYFILSICVLIFLFTGGTFYIYKFTCGFTLIEDSLAIWLLFVISVVIDFYYRFYTPLLMGSDHIADANKIEVIATVSKIIILIILLLCGFRLWAVVISQFVRIIFVRLLSIKVFYTAQIKQIFSGYKNEKFHRFDILRILWYNAKRSMVVSISTYVSTQFMTLLIGLYLSKSDVASYGILAQLVGVISVLSLSINNTMIPLYASLRVQKKNDLQYQNFRFSFGIFVTVSILGVAFLFLIIPKVLVFIGANAVLPDYTIMTIYVVYKMLEGQHCICSGYLTTQNKIVDFESAIIIGILSLILQFLLLLYTDLGLLGLVLIQMFIPMCYPNWKWPYEVCKEFHVSYYELVRASVFLLYKKILNICVRKI